MLVGSAHYTVKISGQNSESIWHYLHNLIISTVFFINLNWTETNILCDFWRLSSRSFSDGHRCNFFLRTRFKLRSDDGSSLSPSPSFGWVLCWVQERQAGKNFFYWKLLSFNPRKIHSQRIKVGVILIPWKGELPS